MEYKTYITQEMQNKWFDSINNKHHFYFIIENQGTSVGLINTSQIDWEKRTGETGLFIWDEKCIDSPVPVFASLSMLDVFFTYFGLMKVTAKVKNDNFKAIAYNASLGFTPCENHPANEFSHYELHASRYFQHAAKLRNSAIKLFGNQTVLELNKSDDTAVFLTKLLENKKFEDLIVSVGL